MKTVALAIATAALGFAGTTTPALASGQAMKSIKVSYADLNLNTTEGQQTLARRVKAAARKVCSYKSGATNVRLRRQSRDCYAKAHAAARKQTAAIVENERRGG